MSSSSTSTSPPTTTTSQEKYKLVFFVPTASAEKVKRAVFATGAGTIGEYKDASFTTVGTAHFTPSLNAKPFIGTPGVEEEVEECRVETNCWGKEGVRAAVEAIKASHPYEEAVYEIYKLEDF